VSAVQKEVSPDTQSLVLFMSAVLEVQLTTSLKYRAAGGNESMLVHDGATVVGIFYPECLKFRRTKLYVDTGAVEQTQGHTYSDNRHFPNRPMANAYVACDVDGPAAISYMVEDFKSFVVALHNEQTGSI
jgi:inosine-uridine nucleoside N-ribohydrolase